MSFLNGTDPGLRQIRAATTDNFAAGVDFTAGSSTQVTLTNDPGGEDNVIITFDGVTQHRNTYTVSGAVVTFDAAIGSGVSNVEATYTTTIPAATPADNSVTLAKLSDGTQGGLIYYGGSGAPTELAAGTSGQFLQTQGAGANPQWAAAGGGSAFLGSTDLSSVATYDFTATDNSTYDAYLIVFANVSPATDARYFRMRTSTDGGSTYDNGAGAYEWRCYRYGPGISSDVATTTEIDIIGDYANPDGQVGNAAGEEGLSGHMWVHGAHLAKHTQFDWHVTYATASNELQGVVGVARRKSSADVDAWRFLFDSGNLASGTITTFGFKNA